MDANNVQPEVEGKYLTFWMENQLYGIPIACVQQIVQFQDITSIPESPDYIRGIINLRGIIIPVVDMRIRFNKEPKGYSERTCIIVTNVRDLTIGFIVEAVDEVTDIEKEFISEPPSISEMGNGGFLDGIGKKKKTVTLLLNLDKIISDNDVEGIAKI